MAKLLVKNKEVVVPGQELAQGLDYLPHFGTYREENAIYASRLGLVAVDGRTIKIIPLAGKYSPKTGDTIIGEVVDVTLMGWIMNINCAYRAMLVAKEATSEFVRRDSDLTRFFSIGDYVCAGIVLVTSQKLVDLTTKGTGLRKLVGGRVIKVNPHKVPRIIGKQGSMISLIKEMTNCKIVVGQNGLVWLQGSPTNENLAVAAIKKVEEESLQSGLTDQIKAFLEEELNKLKPAVKEKEAK